MMLESVAMRQNTTPDVAAEVRVLLARLGHDGSWLAAQLKVSEMWVSRRLRGVTRFTVDDLARIAEVLGVTVADLIPPPVAVPAASAA